MSKLYQMNRMMYGVEAGDPFLAGLLKAGGKLISGLFKKKAPAVVAAAKKAAPVIAGGAASGAAWALGEQLLGPGGAPVSRGASGGWGRRRRRGITATELRGYRKVANLIHKEGMVSRRARGRR